MFKQIFNVKVFSDLGLNEVILVSTLGLGPHSIRVIVSVNHHQFWAGLGSEIKFNMDNCPPELGPVKSLTTLDISF